MSRYWLLLTITGAAVVLGGPSMGAQALGTFRWQLRPFCNVVTLTLTQQDGIYTLDGFDDQCGGPQRAPLVGTAVSNPDGTVGLGLHVVTVPGGRPLHIDARVRFPGLDGSWADSSGNQGVLAFNTSGGGDPRPAPTITGSALAPGSITTAHLSPQVLASLTRAAAAPVGMCPAGQVLRGILGDGTFACEPIGVPPSKGAVPVRDTGLFSSIDIAADGLPLVAHFDAVGYHVAFTKCGNVACTETTTTTDSTRNVGLFTSLTIGSDGFPFVASGSATTGSLVTTHCEDANCGTSTSIDHLPIPGGRYASAAVGTDGLPIISHVASGFYGGALFVTHCKDRACGVFMNSTTTYTGGDGFTSIAIGSDGLPIISDYDAGRLRVTHCNDVPCATATQTIADSHPGRDFGKYTSIAIGADGLAIISHTDSSVGDVRVTHCSNVACTAATSVSVPSPNYDGHYSSLAVGSDGFPIISHYDLPNGDLRVTHCDDTTCAASTSTTVDAAGDVGLHTSIAIGTDGLPVVSYWDQTNRTLRLLKCNSRRCR